MPFPAYFWLFGAFIIACGTTHLLEAITTSVPVYRLSGLVKLLTAVVSVATAVALVPLLPLALAVRTPEELEAEVARRRQAEAQLLAAHAELERVVRERTQSLQESEARYRLLTEALPHMVWTMRADRTLEYLNRSAAGFTGLTVESVNAEGWVRLVHPDDLAGMLAAVSGPLERGEPHEAQYRFRHHSGQYRWVVSSAVPVKDEAGQVVKWIGSTTDVHDQRQAEARFRLAVEAAPSGMVMADSDGGIVLVNAQTEKLFGYDRSELLGQPVEILLPPRYQDKHPADRAGFFAQPSARAMGSGRDLWARRKDGSEFPVEIGLSPVQMESGLHALASIIDISARRAAKEQLEDLNASLERRVIERTEALREQEERFRGAFDFAAIGVALVALDGRWLRVNHALCELVGYTEAELLATNFQQLTYPDDLDADLNYVAQMLAGTIRTYQMEKRYFHKAGHLVHILLAISLVRDGQGNPLYFISQIQDITARKQAQNQLLASLREKEVLLKEIHHRVKNNLQIVSALLDLQSGHTTDRQALEMFRESRSRVRSMALIHERLYRSPDLACVDFAVYIRQLADDLFAAYQVWENGIELDVLVEVPPVPLDLAIPCGLLLNELLSNCLKHAFADVPEGRIQVAIRSANGDTELRVADNGRGFPVTLDFRNASSFGLQLVNTLVEQLHGTITLRVGSGTEIIVRFPTRG